MIGKRVLVVGLVAVVAGACAPKQRDPKSTGVDVTAMFVKQMQGTFSNYDGMTLKIDASGRVTAKQRETFANKPTADLQSEKITCIFVKDGSLKATQDKKDDVHFKTKVIYNTFAPTSTFDSDNANLSDAEKKFCLSHISDNTGGDFNFVPSSKDVLKDDFNGLKDWNQQLFSGYFVRDDSNVGGDISNDFLQTYTMEKNTLTSSDGTELSFDPVTRTMAIGKGDSKTKGVVAAVLLKNLHQYESDSSYGPIRILFKPTTDVPKDDPLFTAADNGLYYVEADTRGTTGVALALLGKNQSSLMVFTASPKKP